MAATATRQAAMPTRLWNAATSCGMAVMATRRAISAPTVPPMATPPTTRPRVSGSNRPWLNRVTSAVPTAIAMPIMPLRLPAWLVVGDDNPRSARMKRTPETM
jgi:hypothetical protein